jgi:hypothetical protein
LFATALSGKFLHLLELDPPPPHDELFDGAGFVTSVNATKLDAEHV